MEDGQTPPSGDADTQDNAATATAARTRRKERHRAVPLTPEVRFFSPQGLEVRREAKGDTDEIIVRGSAIVYGATYRVVDMFGEFEERIHAGAASDLVARGVDCRFLFNHDGLPLGRTTAGTLRLIDGAASLDIELRMDARQQLANDLAIAFERGDVSQMSVGMIVGNDKWGDSAGVDTRDIFALSDLPDVSAVTYPCSPTTHIEVAKRMAFAMPLESRARLRMMEVELRAGKMLSADSQSKLVTALAALHDLASAGGVDVSGLGPNEDEDAPDGHQDGSEGGYDAESDAGLVYPDGSGQRAAPTTAAERREQIESYNDRQRAVYQALLEKLGDGDGDCDLWVYDMSDDWVVWQSYQDPMGMFRCAYTIGADGEVAFSGDVERVKVVTSFEPEDAPPPAVPSLRTSTLRLMVEAGRHGSAD